MCGQCLGPNGRPAILFGKWHRVFPCQQPDSPAEDPSRCGLRLEGTAGRVTDRRASFGNARAFAKSAGLRTVFHPDQFVVLNSPRPDVVDQSIAELEYQAEVARWIGADVVNIHGGGAYGDKQTALRTFAKNFARLSKEARRLVTLENDDRVFTPADLLPFCREHGIPFVYDVHHHRCTPDGMTEEEATRQALTTWNREPLFHISSPLEGWSGPKPYRHHDYINVRDFPKFWLGLDVTVEVEAKGEGTGGEEVGEGVEAA